MKERTIWKFHLADKDIPMPLDAEVCAFQFQASVPCIWAIVDPSAPKVIRRFEIFGTGRQIPEPEECCYVGTAQEGPFVWHLFELL